MRPGQAAPEFAAFKPQLLADSFGFNEAGAGCPGIQETLADSRS